MKSSCSNAWEGTSLRQPSLLIWQLFCRFATDRPFIRHSISVELQSSAYQTRPLGPARSETNLYILFSQKNYLLQIDRIYR